MPVCLRCARCGRVRVCRRSQGERICENRVWDKTEACQLPAQVLAGGARMSYQGLGQIRVRGETGARRPPGAAQVLAGWPRGAVGGEAGAAGGLPGQRRDGLGHRAGGRRAAAVRAPRRAVPAARRLRRMLCRKQPVSLHVSESTFGRVCDSAFFTRVLSEFKCKACSFSTTDKRARTVVMHLLVAEAVALTCLAEWLCNKKGHIYSSGVHAQVRRADRAAGGGVPLPRPARRRCAWLAGRIPGRPD